MTIMLNSSKPEQGQMVSVRARYGMVNGIGQCPAVVAPPVAQSRNDPHPSKNGSPVFAPCGTTI